MCDASRWFSCCNHNECIQWIIYILEEWSLHFISAINNIMWWLSVRVQDIVNKFAFRYVIAHAWHQNPPLVNVQMMPCKHTNTIWFRRRQNKSQWKQTVNWMRQKRGFCLSNIPIYRKMWARSSLNCLFLFAHFEYTHGIEMEKRQRRPAERQSGVKKNTTLYRSPVESSH